MEFSIQRLDDANQVRQYLQRLRDSESDEVLLRREGNTRVTGQQSFQRFSSSEQGDALLTVSHRTGSFYELNIYDCYPRRCQGPNSSQMAYSLRTLYRSQPDATLQVVRIGDANNDGHSDILLVFGTGPGDANITGGVLFTQESDDLELAIRGIR